jgi:hypothetical protein
MKDNYDNTPETGKMFSRRASAKFQEQGADGGQYDLVLLVAHRTKKQNKKGNLERKLADKFYEGSKTHVSIIQEITHGVTTFDELRDEYINDQLEHNQIEDKEQDLIR